ncbi:MAG: HEPN domain-containing protein [Candidatus Micrarchaeota archaeon]|nr:HEPN domain-containing protein [Candidatus Micrarchaeota archaeon]
MGMKKVRTLIQRAAEDLELARRYERVKEYATAAILYNKAIEKALKAMFISKMRREPPVNVSIEYLSGKTMVPEDVVDEIRSLQEEEMELIDAEGNPDNEDYGMSISERAMSRVSRLGGISRRLMDYAIAYSKA